MNVVIVKCPALDRFGVGDELSVRQAEVLSQCVDVLHHYLAHAGQDQAHRRAFPLGHRGWRISTARHPPWNTFIELNRRAQNSA